MIGVINVPAGDVLGTVLPALGVALILGNLYYTFLARRLARRENRTDVTALPYGPSVPHMFIVVFVVMLPVYLNTKDAMQAWQAGLAWAFMIGIIVMIGAFVGPYIRKLTPRAAMLGTLAGISITFISMRPAAQMWEAAWIGLPVLAIILIGFFTDVKLPFGIPVGLAALLVGTAIGWIGGYMSAPDVGQAVSDIAIGIPDLRVDMLFSGLADLAPLLGTAIPLGVYNFTEAMSNVESAAAAGDNYNLRSVLLADGAGAVHRFGVRLAVPARGLHRPPGLEGRRRPGRLLAGQRCGHRNPLLPRPFRCARRAAAGARDRADPALHRSADRRAGVPGGAAAARRRGGRRDPAQPRAVGQRPDRQRAQRRGHLGDRGRDGRAQRRRRGLRGPADPRRGRGAGRPDPRHHGDLHPGEEVPLRRDRVGGRLRCCRSSG